MSRRQAAAVAAKLTAWEKGVSSNDVRVSRFDVLLASPVTGNDPAAFVAWWNAAPVRSALWSGNSIVLTRTKPAPTWTNEWWLTSIALRYGFQPPCAPSSVWLAMDKVFNAAKAAGASKEVLTGILDDKVNALALQSSLVADPFADWTGSRTVTRLLPPVP
jgi:hypothetical protein